MGESGNDSVMGKGKEGEGREGDEKEREKRGGSSVEGRRRGGGIQDDARIQEMK